MLSSELRPSSDDHLALAGCSKLLPSAEPARNELNYAWLTWAQRKAEDNGAHRANICQDALHHLLK